MAVLWRRNRGFTLIELMIVITIIGIMAGLIGLSVVTGDPAKEAQREAQRFINVMSLALDQSAFNQQDLGLHIEDDRYRFLVWALPADTSEDEESGEEEADETTTQATQSGATEKEPEPLWQFVSDEPSLGLYELPEDILIDIEIADSELLQSEEDAETELTETNLNLDEIGPKVEEEEVVEPPHIYILSSGELAPAFRLGFYHVEKPEAIYWVVGDEMGRVGFQKDEFDDSF
ncbi:MAG: type II secretion system minor pseudopilin GspH [Ketobacteraceae bacterium]|nr:type II secretion system minor pseudopilin GspH [Ketobacteraceae bacterium]